jgi:cell division protein FtsA
MTKVLAKEIVVSVDIGTTKICVIVARYHGNDDIEVLGIGRAPSHGLRKGVVVDIGKTVQSLKIALKEAEFVSGHTIESVIIGVSGNHIKSFNSHGAVPIRNNEVRSQDITNALAAAKAVPIQEGQQILHVLPQYFVVDNQEKILNPIGMYGVRLEVEAHIITGSIASVQNIVHCCQMAGVRVSDIVLEQLASADAVLSIDERELGVGVLDIGGGTSDFALYKNGSIQYTMVIPVAGNHVTNDVAIGLQTTLKEAERVKQLYGFALNNDISDESIEFEAIQSGSMQYVDRSKLVHIIEPRIRELLMIVNAELGRMHLDSYMTTGLVLTGGGSLLNGIIGIAQEIFVVPVRIGLPSTHHAMPESLNSPIYATGYGLLLHKIKNYRGSIEHMSGSMGTRIFMRMKSWITDFF